MQALLAIDPVGLVSLSMKGGALAGLICAILSIGAVGWQHWQRRRADRRGATTDEPPVTGP